LAVSGGFLKLFFDLMKFRAFAYSSPSFSRYLKLKCNIIAFSSIIFSLFYKYDNQK